MKTAKINETTFVYQTNCLYQSHGQIIGVRVMDDHVIMVDYSRGLYLRIDIHVSPRLFMSNISASVRYIHNQYLHNNYTMDVDYVVLRELESLIAQNLHLVPLERQDVN